MGIEMPQCGATGVVVRPGETVKCDPGGSFCHISQIALQAGKGNEDVRIFMKVDGKEFLIATLSDDRYPHYRTDLCLEKEFELLHSSKTRSISVIGNNFSNLEKKSGTSSEQDNESCEEIPLAFFRKKEENPLAVPLYPSVDVDKSKEAESSAEKLAAPPGPAAKSSTSKETMDPEKLQTDVGGSDDDDSDEDYVDSEEGETNDEDFQFLHSSENSLQGEEV